MLEQELNQIEETFDAAAEGADYQPTPDNKEIAVTLNLQGNDYVMFNLAGLGWAHTAEYRLEYSNPETAIQQLSDFIGDLDIKPAFNLADYQDYADVTMQNLTDPLLYRHIYDHVMMATESAFTFLPLTIGYASITMNIRRCVITGEEVDQMKQNEEVSREMERAEFEAREKLARINALEYKFSSKLQLHQGGKFVLPPETEEEFRDPTKRQLVDEIRINTQTNVTCFISALLNTTHGLLGTDEHSPSHFASACGRARDALLAELPAVGRTFEELPMTYTFASEDNLATLIVTVESPEPAVEDAKDDNYALEA